MRRGTVGRRDRNFEHEPKTGLKPLCFVNMNRSVVSGDFETLLFLFLYNHKERLLRINLASPHWFSLSHISIWGLSPFLGKVTWVLTFKQRWKEGRNNLWTLKNINLSEKYWKLSPFFQRKKTVRTMLSIINRVKCEFNQINLKNILRFYTFNFTHYWKN